MSFTFLFNDYSKIKLFSSSAKKKKKKFQGNGHPAAQVGTYPRKNEIMEDSWRDVSKNNVELLNMCWNTVGDVISVWQSLGDELVTVS